MTNVLQCYFGSRQFEARSHPYRNEGGKFRVKERRVFRTFHSTNGISGKLSKLFSLVSSRNELSRV